MENKKSDQPVTKSEFLSEISKLATKQDFNKIANEIVKIQTDMKTMATKEDIESLAVKEVENVDEIHHTHKLINLVPSQGTLQELIAIVSKRKTKSGKRII